MRGPKPQPTVIKMLRGNPGKRAFNQEEPAPAGVISTEMPEELTTAIEQSEWNKTIVPAIRNGTITATDRPTAIAHCVYWATWRSQLLEAERHPHIIAVGPNKHPMPNPARGMANKTYQILLKIDADLGLTPSSRSRVHASKGSKPMSAVEKFKAEKQRRA